MADNGMKIPTVSQAAQPNIHAADIDKQHNSGQVKQGVVCTQDTDGMQTVPLNLKTTSVSKTNHVTSPTKESTPPTEPERKGLGIGGEDGQAFNLVGEVVGGIAGGAVAVCFVAALGWWVIPVGAGAMFVGALLGKALMKPFLQLIAKLFGVSGDVP